MTGHKDHEMAIAGAGAEAPASFVMQPQPQNGSFRGKLRIFGLGFVAGVATLTIAAAVVEKMGESSPDNAADDLSIQPQGEAIDITDFQSKQ